MEIQTGGKKKKGTEDFPEKQSPEINPVSL